MKVIHIITNISTMLGIVDENGDVVQRVPVQGEIARLSVEEFIKAAEAIQAERVKLQEKQDANSD